MSVLILVGVAAATVTLFAAGRTGDAVRMPVSGGVIAYACAKMGARARTPQAARAADFDLSLPTVLLLRAFRDDRLQFSTQDGRRIGSRLRRAAGWLSLTAPTCEQYLGPAVAERIGPIIGLGNPVDYLPPEKGMLRYYAPDDDWQAEVGRLVAQVRAVLVFASSSTQSLAWELRHLRKVAAQPKTFVVLSRFPPPGEPGAPRQLWFNARLRGMRPVPWPRLVTDMAALGWFLPPTYPGPASVIGFDTDGQGRVLVTGARTAHDFAAAIALALDSRTTITASAADRVGRTALEIG